MKLITELYEEVQFLSEKTNDGAEHGYITGIMAQFDVVNRNKRNYPPTLKKEVHRYIKENVNERTGWGELGHPKEPKLNEERFSHRIINLQEDGNNFIGKAMLLDTPSGNIATSLIKSGGKIGVSTRALGSLRPKKGYQEVQEDFSLRAFDIVADPSAPDAFVDGIFEGKEWVYENGIWKEQDLCETRKLLSKTSSRNFEQIAIAEFKKYLSQLRV